MLKQGTPHKLHTKSMDTVKQMQQSNNGDAAHGSHGAQHCSKLQLNDYVCPVEELDEEREFYLYHFKTQPCSILDPNPSSLCAKDLCAGYHEPKKVRFTAQNVCSCVCVRSSILMYLRVFIYLIQKRRTPAIYQYTSEPCSNVKSSAGVWLDPAQCYNGDNCPKAHVCNTANAVLCVCAY